ncbi:NAD-dependent epimerase/dehydratase family protein [Olivibacter sp. SDN3]|uniref:NAD-dependent epimerase/dehydratase family protein n=1 Tax=Olivibacter sp. SDN3 TaxID=2764720 RepID=UPI001651553B|nr:NAD-dependent epimerase/dehydratase family protein [Olivibacter sp. SDN3]QNL52012.1 NAD-dependent epimerase/dehydratase family protein [Olivibacter sp. SDN3]
MGKDVILVVGANGQVGKALLPQLIEIYGDRSVIAVDITSNIWSWTCRFFSLDATDPKKLYDIIHKYGVTQIYHLAAILSANGERNPSQTWDVNIRTMLNVLEIAKTTKASKVFIPSSIAVFGPSAVKENTEQFSYLDPTTVYGISKVATENWIYYYNVKYHLDIRSLRYPGIIGAQSIPNGGTTDYAVEMFYKAITYEVFTCYLKPGTVLPMIYIDDAIRATIELMDAPLGALRIRSSYNLAATSFDPSTLTACIKQYIPNLKVYFEPDFRQKIAESWPDTIDDHYARTDWQWKPLFDLKAIISSMMAEVRKAIEKKGGSIKN